MSITDAIAAYDASFFGSGSTPPPQYSGGSHGGSHGGYRSTGRGGDCCIIFLPNSSSSGSEDSKEAVLALLLGLAVAAAAASAAVFAFFSADAYKTAAEMGNSRRSAVDEEPDVKNNIKKVFRHLEAERALTGTAYLSVAVGLSLLIVACVFVLMKKPQQQYLKFAIAGGAVTGAFVPFFGLSFLMNPVKEVDILRKVQLGRQSSRPQVVPSAPPRNGQQSAPTPLPHNGELPPPYED